MSTIEIKSLTKDYGKGRGIFDVSINIEKGVCYGFLGPNGAGKTTTIRHIMGFSKAQVGSCTILGKNCWECASELKDKVGYLPGEIVFPAGLKGREFLDMMKNMRNMKSESYLNELLKRFDLNPDKEIKGMSLGEKRKLAVVTAFMHDPEILILDEPTSGLDPIMQQIFIDYILAEKKRGKTILLSSHIFHEIDAACDEIAIIKDGIIVSKFKADDLRSRKSRIYRISFDDSKDYSKFIKLNYNFTSKNEKKKRARVFLEDGDVNKLLNDISYLSICDFEEIPFTLEDFFMQFYKRDRVFEEVK